jgi:hypothetical protein
MGRGGELEMAYGSSTEGGYGIGASVFHFDASHPDRIDIPDPELLFRGHFGRSGPDLVLTGQDGHHHIVPDYFASEKHPSLYAPNGAHLSGDLVDLLAGSPTPGHYAQANGPTLPPDAIGKVQKVVGNVTVLRNGTAVTLHVGDAVHKSDVIETGANSSCGIAFPDGTALDLVANTRMALNEYTYDVAGAPNNALFTLVEGTFAFVAGQVAHTGEGMKISTPVATMGIRGTVGLFKTERTVISANLGHVWSVFLHEDIDGSHHLGRIAFIDQDPTSPTFGQVFYLLDSSEYIAYLEPRTGEAPLVRLEPITNSRVFEDRPFFDDLAAILNSYLNGTVNPQSTPGTPGSSTPPDLFKIQLQLFPSNGGLPQFPIVPFIGPNFNPPSGPQGPGTFVPVFPGQNPNPHNTTPPTPSTAFIWNGIGTWPTNSPWNQGFAPNSSIDTVEVQSGFLTYDLPGTTVAGLTVDPGATLDVIGGSLFAGGLLDGGTINVDGDPPVMVVTGSATIASGGSFNVQDGSATFTSGSLANFGTLTAGHLGSVLIAENAVNAGTIQAIKGGIVTLENATITNSITDAHGNIVDGTIFVGSTSEDSVSHLVLDNGAILQGIVHVGAGGEIDTVSGTANTIDTANGPSHNTTMPSLTIDAGGAIVIVDNSSLALASPFDIENNGRIDLASTGHQTILYFNQPFPILAGNGTIFLEGGPGAQDIIAGLTGDGFNTVTLDNQGNTIEGAGQIGQNNGALTFTNDIGSTINADLSGQTLFVETGALFTNNALLEATNGGILDVLDNVVSTFGTPLVQISNGGDAIFAGTFSQDVKFIGSGSLALAHTLDGAYGADIQDFGGGDTIVLNDLKFVPASETFGFDSATGILTVSNGIDTSTIHFAGNYVQADFNVVDDNGVSEIIDVGDEWIGPSSEDRTGTWTASTPLNWSLGVVPNSALNAIVDLPGKYSITMSGDQSANSLTITDTQATLTGSGMLALGSFENHGKIKVGGDDNLDIQIASLSTNDGVIKSVGGTLTLTTGADDTFVQLFNNGRLAARDGGNISVDGVTVINNLTDDDGTFVPGRIRSVGEGSDITFSDGAALFNLGRVAAVDGGTINFDDVNVSNQAGFGGEGRLAATGDGSEILFSDGATFTNQGVALAKNGGEIDFRHATVTNDAGGDMQAGRFGTLSFFKTSIDNSGGTIGAIGHGAQILIRDSGLTNAGTLQASDCGSVCVDHAKIDNQSSGEIDAKDGGIVNIDDSFVLNGGTMDAERFGTIRVDHAFLKNTGMIEAVGHDAQILVRDSDLSNAGTLQALDCGSVCVDCVKIDNQSGGEIDAKDGGIITLSSVLLTNAPASAPSDSNPDGEPAGKILTQDGGTIRIDDSFVRNGGIMDAERFGTIRIAHSLLKNAGTMEAVGLCSALILTCDLIANTGHVLAKDAGAVEVTDSKLLNRGAGAEIEAKDCGSIVSFCHDSVANKHGAEILATDFGTILFDDDKIANKHGSTIQASLGGLIKIDHSEIINKHDSFITAGVGGDITLAHDCITNTGESFIEANGRDSVVYLEHSFVANDGGTIAALGHDAVVNLFDSTIVGGTLETQRGGVIETVTGPEGHHSTSTFEDLTNEGYVLVQSNTTLALKGTIHNDGTIVVDPESGRGADLQIDGKVFLDGSGTVELDGRHDKITGGPDGGTLVNSSTIDGFGQIGACDDDLTLHNKASGTIDADVAHKTLVVDTGGNTVVNAGLMEATLGGTLEIDSRLRNSAMVVADKDSDVTLDAHVHNKSGGEILADGDNAQVEFLNDSVRNQGTFDANHHGTLLFDGATVWNASGVMNAEHHGVIELTDGATIIDGTINVHDNSILDVEDTATLKDVTVNMVDPGTIDVGETTPSGAILYLDDSTIIGGTLATAGGPFAGSAIQVINGTSTLDGRTGGAGSAVTVTGYVQVEAGAKLAVEGKINLDGGVIELDQADTGHRGSALVIDGNVTLSGDGYVALEGRHTEIIAGGDGGTLTNDSFIYGSRGGNIGDGTGSLTFINNGTVNSEGGAHNPLVINTGDTTVNTGTLEATAASELDLYGSYDNRGGTINASAEGLTPEQGFPQTAVKLFDATIQGGTLLSDDPTSSQGGMIEVVAIRGDDDPNMSVFDGSHNHAVTVDAYVNVDSGANLELLGTIHNQGTINVDGDATTDLLISGTVKLDGGGAITLDGSTDQIVGVSDTDAVNKLDNVDNTIQGAGNIGDGDLSLTNESAGLIDANVFGQTLTINTGHTFENDGTLGADGGRLVVDDNVHGSGSVFIADGGTADFVGNFNQEAAFLGTGTFELHHSRGDDGYSATITGFSYGDTIDLNDLQFSSHDKIVWTQISTADGGDGVLTVENQHGGTLETLNLNGTYTQSEFALQTDGASGTPGTDVVWTGPGVECINGVKTEVGFASDATVAIQDGEWVVNERGQTFTLANGVESVVLGSTTYMLVDQNDGGFQSLQAAIDKSQNGDTILVAPGTYTESANYNPNTGLDDPNFTNPLGLLVDKSVTIEGVDSHGNVINNAADTQATIVASIESDWGTNFYITAPNVTITGLDFEGTDVAYGQGDQGTVNKVIEIVANNVTLANDDVAALPGVPVGSSVYVDELTVPSNLAGYVADIKSFDIAHNILTGDFVEASGVGYGDATTNLQLTDNTFALNAGTTLAQYVSEDGGGNDVVILNGDLASIGIGWDLAPVVAPTATGNVVEPGYTTSAEDGALFLVWDASSSPYLPDATYIADYVANNQLGTYAYALTAAGAPDYSTDGNTSFYFIHINAGDASASGAANPGDTIVVESGSDSSQQTIGTDNLTIDALSGSTALNLLLGSGVHTITLEDHDTSGGNLTVTGNSLSDSIVDKLGTENLTVNAGTGAITLEVTAGVTSQNIDFNATAGTIKIDSPPTFNGVITIPHSDPADILDLAGFGSHTNDTFATSTSLNAGVTTLTVTDETQHTSESVNLAGDFTGATWNVTADGNGGADVADPPATTVASADAGGSLTITDGAAAPATAIQVDPNTPVVAAVTDVDGTVSEFMLGNDQINLAPGQTATDTHNNVTAPDPAHPGATVNTVSVTVGGPGNDNFVFAPGIGADTITNFNPQADTIELNHFANVQNTQQLAAAITTDAHGDAVIDLGHSDSITVAGVSGTYLQQHLQSMVHLH